MKKRQIYDAPWRMRCGGKIRKSIVKMDGKISDVVREMLDRNTGNCPCCGGAIPPPEKETTERHVQVRTTELSLRYKKMGAGLGITAQAMARMVMAKELGLCIVCNNPIKTEKEK